MPIHRWTAFATLCLLVCLPGRALAEDLTLHFYSPLRIHYAKLDLQDPDSYLQASLQKLIAQANGALQQAPLSVVNKEQLPASGDPHDYLSYAPYWWPNPDTADGLPWVNHDGERSPQAAALPNRRDKSALTSALKPLCLAWHFTDDERYAEHAALLLRVWFLDDATRMNPNLNHAQAIPGITDGRGIGIIDWAGTPEMLDWITMLETWDGWTAEDRAGIRQWFGEFQTWLLTSRHGKAEAGQLNNHGTYYDCIVASIALFLGDEETARDICSAAGDRRLAPQIAANGSQPLELRRTKSWDYSIYNLQAMVILARLGKACGVDLWHYKDEEGAGIREALLFLLPYAQGEQEWKWTQIKEIHYESYISMMNELAYVFSDEALPAEIARIPAEFDSTDSRALYQW